MRGLARPFGSSSSSGRCNGWSSKNALPWVVRWRRAERRSGRLEEGLAARTADVAGVEDELAALDGS